MEQDRSDHSALKFLMTSRCLISRWLLSPEHVECCGHNRPRHGTSKCARRSLIPDNSCTIAHQIQLVVQ